MKSLIAIFMSVVFLFAEDITPAYEIQASGNVIDVVVKKNLLYAGTDAGIVDVIDWQKGEVLKEIEIETIHDFMGDVIKAKIFSVDISSDDSTILFVSQGETGYRNVFLSTEKGLEKVIDEKKDKLYINKARYVDDNTILMGLLSNELILFDLKKKETIYRFQLNQSSFADFTLNEDKSKVAVGCESGEIFIVDTRKGEILKILKGAHVDKTFKVDFKSGRVSGAGQDRRGSVYDVETGSYDIFEGSFLIYAGSLSADGKFAAFAYNQNNDIAIYDVDTKSKKFVLKGQKSTMNTIVFIDNNTLVSASDDKYLMVWKLK